MKDTSSSIKVTSFKPTEPSILTPLQDAAWDRGFSTTEQSTEQWTVATLGPRTAENFAWSLEMPSMTLGSLGHPEVAGAWEALKGWGVLEERFS